MYPPMYEQAKAEGHKASKMFKWAMDVEKVHEVLYKKALEAIEAGRDLDQEVYLCPVCGHLELGKAPDKCPVCNLPSSKYQLIQ